MFSRGHISPRIWEGLAPLMLAAGLRDRRTAPSSAMTEKQVAVLFALQTSIYKRIRCCDVYDIDRNALTFPGGLPVVAHPPCRSWSRLSHLAKPAPGEKELAPWAVEQVRRNGGVLEHPWRSKLWNWCAMPLPGQGRDRFGGWTIQVHQAWWGHKALKATLLYIVGVDGSMLPAFPVDRLTGPSSEGAFNRLSERQRHATPEPFARYLVGIAQRVGVSKCFTS